MADRSSRRALLDITEEINNLDPKFTRKLGVFKKTASTQHNENAVSISNVSKLISDGHVRKAVIPKNSNKLINSFMLNQLELPPVMGSERHNDVESSTSITKISTLFSGAKHNKMKPQYVRRISSMVHDSGLHSLRPMNEVPLSRKDTLLGADEREEMGELSQYLKKNVESIRMEDLLIDYKQVVKRSSLEDSNDIWTVDEFILNKPSLKLVRLYSNENSEMIVGLGIFKNEYEVLKREDKIILGNYKLKGFEDSTHGRLDIYYRWKKIV